MTCVAGLPSCPVVDLDDVDLRRVRTTEVRADQVFHRSIPDGFPLESLNPSPKQGRFSPVPGTAFAYLGGSHTVALLESVFHEVTPSPTSRAIYRDLHLRGRVVGTVVTDRNLRVIDLRDGELERLDIDRAQLITTGSEHYPCSTAVAARLLQLTPGHQPVQGIVWGSRVAEIARSGSELLGDLLHDPVSEALVVYGDPADSPLRPSGPPIHLLNPDGTWLPFVDEIAEQLDAVIET